MTLPEEYERSILEPALIFDNDNDYVVFATTIPEAGKDEFGVPIPCAAGGTGFLMTVDVLTGLAPSTPLFDITGDGSVNNQDKVGADGYVVSGLKVLGLPTAPKFVKRDESLADRNSNATHDSLVNTSNGVTSVAFKKPSANKLKRHSWREIKL
jgi:type IV pilus assembly protein PilY1